VEAKQLDYGIGDTFVSFDAAGVCWFESDRHAMCPSCRGCDSWQSANPGL